MLFDATVSRDGKVQKVRGNQSHLDKLVGEGYQVIDKFPVVAHRPVLPKDIIHEEVIGSVSIDPVVITGGV